MARDSVNSVVFSPRFKSVAAMAGWDEDSLLSASLIVDDTPERELSHKKRSVFQLKTPPSTDSRKKRRVQESRVISVPIVTLDLGDEAVETAKKETKKDTPKTEKEETNGEREVSKSLPCIDKLREELSCAICLDICFEPSTTPCGHSFCLKCLRFSASKCGKKCPKCRQMISNGRSCTVNTVLWNTIQLLFPQEVEAKKAASASKSRESEHRQKIPEISFYDSLRSGSSRDSDLPRRRSSSTQSSRNENPATNLELEIRRNIRAASSRVSSRESGGMASQDGDRAMALRLQREEFLGSVRRSISANPISANPSSNSSTNSPSSFSSARENLRAMASRAVTTLRVRRQTDF